jgi:Protein of unknown function (DUF998)
MLQGQELLGIEVTGVNRGDAVYGLADLDLAATSTYLRIAQVVGLAGIAAFVFSVLALHGLRSDLNPAEHTVSEYSLGKYGWLMRAAFAALGLGALATAVGLRFRVEPSAWRRLGNWSLVATAAGLLLDAGFNTDHLRVRESFDGTLHGDGMLIICLTLPAVACILGADFVHCSSSARARWLLALGPAQFIAILGFEVSPFAFRGLAERLAVTLGVATLVLLQSFVVSPAVECGQTGAFPHFPGGDGNAGHDMSDRRRWIQPDTQTPGAPPELSVLLADAGVAPASVAPTEMC